MDNFFVMPVHDQELILVDSTEKLSTDDIGYVLFKDWNEAFIFANAMADKLGYMIDYDYFNEVEKEQEICTICNCEPCQCDEMYYNKRDIN